MELRLSFDNQAKTSTIYKAISAKTCTHNHRDTFSMLNQGGRSMVKQTHPLCSLMRSQNRGRGNLPYLTGVYFPFSPLVKKCP